MNKSYRSIYNETLGAWVAIAENAPSRGKSSRNRVRLSGMGGGVTSSLSLLAGLVMAIFVQPAIAQTTTNGAICNRASATATVWTCQVPNATGGFAIISNVPSAAGGGPSYADLNLAVGNLGTNNSLLIGDINTKANNAGAIAIGNSAVDESYEGVALGARSKVDTNSQGSIAVGSGASVVNSLGGVALGTESRVNGSHNGVAIAYDARATAEYAIAIGNSSRASAKQTVAIGNAAEATVVSAVAIGDMAAASNTRAIAIGGDASNLTKASGIESIAIGSKAIASSEGAIAQGRNAQADKISDVAIGSDTHATGSVDANGDYKNAVAVGALATANGPHAIALGAKAKADSDSALAVGAEASATSQQASAFGVKANAAGEYSLAVGTNAKSDGYGSAAVGGDSTASGKYATAMGGFANAGGEKSTAIGYAATASKASAVAIGDLATASATNGVALGSNSVASAGSNGAGYVTTPTTAASYTADKAAIDATTVGALAPVSVGTTTATRQIQNVAAGTLDSDAVNVSQLKAAGKGWDVTTAKTGTGTVSGTSVTNVAPGEKVTFTAGNNLIGTQNGKEVQFALNPVLTDITSIAITNGATISSTGIDMGGDKITNMAAGVTAKDAVNVSQLTPLVTALGGGAAIDATTGAVTAPSYTITKTDGTSYAAANNVGAALGNLNTEVVKPITFAGDSGTNVKRTLGTTLNIVGGADASGVTNISTKANGTDKLEIIMTDKPTFSQTTVGTVITNAGGNGKITGLTAGTVSATSTDAVNGSQLNDVKTTANKGWDVAATKVTGTTGKVVSNTGATNVAPGATATWSAGNNIELTRVGTEVQIATSMTPVFTSVELTSGQKLSSTGLDMNGTTISNVKDGVNGKDAVNVSQLTPLVTALGGGAKIDATTGAVTAPSYVITKTDGTTYTAANNVGAALTNLNNEVVKPITFAGNSGTAVDRKLGTTLNIVGGADASGVTNISTKTVGTDKLEIIMTDKPTFSQTTVGTVITNAGGNGKITGLTAGTVSATSTDAVNGSQLNDVKTTANKGWDLTAQGANSSNVAPGDVVDLSNTDGNIVVKKTATSDKVTFDLAKDIKVDSLTAGNTLINNAGLSFIGGGPSITNTGINAGGYVISNVAPGSISTTSKEAVNGSQLYHTNMNIVNTLGGTSSYNAATNTVTAGLKVGSTTYTTVQDALTQVNATANAGWNLSANGGTASNVAPGGTVDVSSADGNVKITQTGTKLDLSLNPNLSLTSVKTGDTTINTNGLTITGGPSVTKTGIDGGGKAITGVGDGAITATSKEAVNGSQLYAVSAAANAGWNVAATAVTGTSGKVVSSTGAANVGPGGTATWSAGNNIEITRVGTEVQIATSMAPKFTSVELTTGQKLSSAGLDMNNTKITNLTSGTAAGDAVNVGQLTALGTSTAGGLGGGSTYNAATNTVSSPVYNVIGGSVNNAGDAITNVISKSPMQYSTPAGVATPFTPSNNVTLVGATAGPVTIHNVAPGVAGTDAVNVSQLNATNSYIAAVDNRVAAVDNQAVKYAVGADGAVDYTNVTMGAGKTDKPVTIHNVANGVAPSDAVNVGQLNAGLGDAKKAAYAGTATALAMQSPASYVPGKTSMRVGVGYYKGETALGLNLRRTAENNASSISAGIGGNSRGAGVTLGYELVFD